MFSNKNSASQVRESTLVCGYQNDLYLVVCLIKMVFVLSLCFLFGRGIFVVSERSYEVFQNVFAKTFRL